MSLRVVVCVIILLALSPLLLLAQFTSSVQGTVADQSGAIVPEVHILLTNVDTGVSIDTRSNESGVFRFPNLPPGKYRLRASKTGFQTLVQENIVLESGRIQGVPVTLSVGAVNQEVTVTEFLIPVETTNPKISTTVTNEYVQSIPLNVRNIYNVVQLAPGVSGYGAGSGDSFQSSSSASATANGMRMNSNGYFVDGGVVDDMANGGAAKITPNPDSVDEVRVSVNDYSAQYGKNAGILTQVITKGGTNQYHGTLFWFHRNNILTSRTFLQSTVNPALGRAMPVYRRNEAGFSVGGPIRKDKTFFFGSVDLLRSSRGVGSLQTVETPEFVAYMKKYYPNNVSTSLMSLFPGSTSGFQGGSIQTVANLSPGCTPANAPLGMPCDLPVRGSAAWSDANKHDGLQWNARIDQTFRGGKDRVYGAVYRTTFLNDSKNARSGFSTQGRDGEHNPSWSFYTSVNYTHIFSPTMINEMSSSFMWGYDGTPCNNCRVPTITVSGLAGFGNGWAPGVFITRDITWQDVISITRGTHLLKFGASYYVNQEPLMFTPPLARPSFTFLNVFDFAADKPISESSINFDPRTGKVTGAPGAADNERDFRLPYYSFFGQDDWKVKKNLTINLGLRYEFNRNPSDATNKMTNVYLGDGATMMDRIKGMSVRLTPGGKELFQHMSHLNFAPRLGIAWDPTNTGKLSVRAGGGVFHDAFLTKSTFDRMQLNPPNFAALSVRSDDPAGPKPIFVLGTTDTSPFGFVLPGVQAGLNPAGGPIAGRSQIAGAQTKNPAAYNWFFGIQYAFTPKWVVEANYVGSRGLRQYTITDRNRCGGCGVARLSPYFAILEWHDNSADSIYHGATFVVRRLFDRGLAFQASYSIGKAIDVVNGGGGIGTTWGTVYDAWNMRAQRGVSENDYPQRLAASYVWDVPTPNVTNRLLKGVIGGWQGSGMIILQSGQPRTVNITNKDYNNDAQFLDKPDAPTKTFPGWSRSDYINGTFKASDFPAPTTVRQGNIGRNTYRGPGFAQVDMSLIKNTKVPWFIGEPARLQVRIEAFNLFNRVNLSTWDTNMASGTFGKATAARDPRTFQLGLRMVF